MDEEEKPRIGWGWPDLSIPRQCRRDIRMGGLPKKKYPSKTAGQKDAGPYDSVYECEHCGHWHIGHKRGGGRLRRHRR